MAVPGQAALPRRGSVLLRNDSTDTGSVGNQSVGTANFLGVPKSDSPGLLTVPGKGNPLCTRSYPNTMAPRYSKRPWKSPE